MLCLREMCGNFSFCKFHAKNIKLSKQRLLDRTGRIGCHQNFIWQPNSAHVLVAHEIIPSNKLAISRHSLPWRSKVCYEIAASPTDQADTFVLMNSNRKLSLNAKAQIGSNLAGFRTELRAFIVISLKRQCGLRLLSQHHRRFGGNAF